MLSSAACIEITLNAVNFFHLFFLIKFKWFCKSKIDIWLKSLFKNIFLRNKRHAVQFSEKWKIYFEWSRYMHDLIFNWSYTRRSLLDKTSLSYTTNYSKKLFFFDPTCKIQLDRQSDNVFVINLGHLYMDFLSKACLWFIWANSIVIWQFSYDCNILSNSPTWHFLHKVLLKEKFLLDFG